MTSRSATFKAAAMPLREPSAEKCRPPDSRRGWAEKTTLFVGNPAHPLNLLAGVFRLRDQRAVTSTYPKTPPPRHLVRPPKMKFFGYTTLLTNSQW